jgi:hypothetical protein
LNWEIDFDINKLGGYGKYSNGPLAENITFHNELN